MPISVTNIGENGITSSANTVTLSSVTVPSGALIAVGTSDSSNASSGGTLSDGGTNTYTSIVSKALNNSSGQGFSQVWYSNNVSALSGATLTYTFASTSKTGCLSALYATGIAASNALDTAVTASATGNSASPSVTSGTPAVAGELFLAWVGYTGINGQSYTQDSTHNWATPFANFNSTTSNTKCGGGGNQVNAGTGTIVFAPTLGSGQAWAAFVVGFKAALGITFVPTANDDIAAICGNWCAIGAS